MYIFLTFVFNSVTSQTWIVFHYLIACSTMPVLIVRLHKSTGACSVDTVIILLIPSVESVGAVVTTQLVDKHRHKSKLCYPALRTKYLVVTYVPTFNIDSQCMRQRWHTEVNFAVLYSTIYYGIFDFTTISPIMFTFVFIRATRLLYNCVRSKVG